MRPSRAGWVLTTLAVLSLWLLAPDARTLISSVHGTDFPKALIALVTLVQLALAAWVLIAVTIALISGSSSMLRAITPRLMRRALFAGAAGALVLVPAHAAPSSSSDAYSLGHSLTGLQLPDRPVAAALPATRQPDRIVVRPGDTLWSIAARALPDGAADDQIARACAHWYAANRGVIGNDPDLILPGQHLVPPPAKDLI